MDRGIFWEKLQEGMKRNNVNTQKEVADLIGVPPSTITSWNPNSKSERYRQPTVDQLESLSEKLCVSIDWLLGKEKANNENLSPRDFCNILANISNTYEEMGFKRIQVEEECKEGIFSSDELRTNEYTAIYFSEWKQETKRPPSNNPSIQSIQRMRKILKNNYSKNSGAINKFISRLKSLQEIHRKGDLDTDMYKRLLESYLNDVPSFQKTEPDSSEENIGEGVDSNDVQEPRENTK